MGLGLHLRAEGARNLLGRRPEPRKLALELAKAMRTAAASVDPLFERQVSVGQDEEVVYVHLHPADEAVQLQVEEKHLVVSARTNGGGPGYHAFLVDVLEQAARACRITLHGDGDDETYSDETGYRVDRDFRRLQAQMSGWLRRIAQLVAQEAREEGSIGMPVGTPLVPTTEVLSPMGLWKPEWFREVAEADDARLAQHAARFFPWWERGVSAEVWRNLGRVMLWSEVPWHPPRREEEQAVCEQALACFERARQLAPGLALPEAELSELRALMKQEFWEAEPPAPEGAGLRRQTVRWPITAGWSLLLPGYWYRDSEDEGRTHMLWFGERTVRLTVFRGRQGEVELPAPQDKPGRLAFFEREEGPLRAWAQVGPYEEDGEHLWMMEAQARVGRSLCLLTAVFPDASDVAWAEALFRSLRGRPPEN